MILGCGGLYRYHTGNDHLACISKAKGGDTTNILETLYLAPKHLEDKVYTLIEFHIVRKLHVYNVLRSFDL